MKLKKGDLIRIQTRRIDLTVDIERVNSEFAWAGEFKFNRSLPLIHADADIVNWSRTQYSEQPTFTVLDKK